MAWKRRLPFAPAWAALVLGALCSSAFFPPLADAETVPLAPGSGLDLQQVVASAGQLDGQAGLRLVGQPSVLAESATRRDAFLATLKAPPTPADFDAYETEHLAVVEGIEFSNGTIEIELAGVPAPGAGRFARGFVGVAFRVQPGGAYDCFYLRPTNGRAPEQTRRNHSTQYIAHPDWPWHRLRAESPGQYESYADMAPGQWISVKIRVDGERAFLHVGGAEQPSLVVNDLKSGPEGKGQVALWIHGSTEGHFRNLRITPR